jgi:hypothetical protein
VKYWIAAGVLTALLIVFFNPIATAVMGLVKAWSGE